MSFTMVYVYNYSSCIGLADVSMRVHKIIYNSVFPFFVSFYFCMIFSHFNYCCGFQRNHAALKYLKIYLEKKKNVKKVKNPLVSLSVDSAWRSEQSISPLATFIGKMHQQVEKSSLEIFGWDSWNATPASGFYS